MRATRLSAANYNTTLSSDSLESGTGSSNSLVSVIGDCKIAMGLGSAAETANPLVCRRRQDRSGARVAALLNAG
jgi:hypothetical protein